MLATIFLHFFRQIFILVLRQNQWKKCTDTFLESEIWAFKQYIFLELSRNWREKNLKKAKNAKPLVLEH